MPRVDYWTKYTPYIGRRYGQVVVVSLDGRNEHGIARANIVCDCGAKKTANIPDIDAGKIVSCGCKPKRRTHGKKRHQLYGVWCGIKERCYRKSHQDFYLYGARGIYVCDEWVSDFQEFYEWAIKNSYAKGLTIDRVNVDGPYSPHNCRFVDAFAQANNTRRNVRITINGETKTVAEWARHRGINSGTLNARINKLGWEPERAVLTPVRPIDKQAASGHKSAAMVAIYDRSKKRVEATE